MPLELVNLVKGFHPPTVEDRGFLINMTRTQWNNSATTEAMNLLRAYAEPYYEMKVGGTLFNLIFNWRLPELSYSMFMYIYNRVHVCFNNF